MSLLFRTTKTASVARRVFVARVPAARHVSRITEDPETIEREKLKNLQGKQDSTHKHAPGWNETLATHAEANVKADKATGTAEEMTVETVQYLKKKHPDSLTDQIREHTSAPYMKDTIKGPLGAVKDTVKKAADSFAEAAAEDPNEVQGHLSDKGAKAEQARRAGLHTGSEAAVKADRGEH